MQNCLMSPGSVGHRVMIIDDDPQVLRLLGAIVENEGASVKLEVDPRQGLEHLRGHPIDVLFTDLHMSGCDGIEVIREARRLQPGISTVIITAYATVASSVDAFRLGAVDYLTKPFRAEQVAGALGRAAARNGKVLDRSLEPKRSLHPTPNMQSSLIARSPAMKDVIESAKAVAASSVPVLVTGEVGTGKERIIRFIHALSPQSSGPLVKVNCEAVSENQLAEIMFGSESSTGEVTHGAIERASGGVLFLHRVANIPLWMQAELAKTFQNRRFSRVGGAAIAVEARVVASTSDDLEPLVRSGQFVDDLHQFINVAPLEMPPLRRRREDIRSLVMSLMRDVECQTLLQDRRRTIEFTEDALDKLEHYEWPGNVYELGNFLRRAIVFSTKSRISAKQVVELLPPARSPDIGEMISVPYTGDLKQMERALVTEVINRSHGNKSAAARTLGLHRKSLYRIMEPEDGSPTE